jgi:hypothetical protein
VGHAADEGPSAPVVLFHEAVRVSRSLVLLEDHLDENFFDKTAVLSKEYGGLR